MGFNTHSWNNPITLDANNLNRIEQGIKNSHDTIEIINEEVSNLQNRHADIVKDLNALTKDAPNIIETLNNISSLLKNNDISAVLSSADNFLMKTKQTLTSSELNQIYKNLHMDKFLKLTSVKVDGNNVVNGSEINIVLPKIDDTLDINSSNAISNKAVTKALSNINIEVDVPTHLSQLQQDKDHLTVSIAEKTKWDSYKDILDNIRIEETDPTVPAWAKEPVKPLYHYNEIIDVPDLTVYINKVTSVNNKTGDIVLNATDVGALPSTTELFSGNYNDLTNKPNIPSISGLASESYVNTKGGLYRGTFDTWDLVPTDIGGYNQDNNGNTTPLQNDYIVLNNGSGKLDDSSFIYQPNITGGGASIANTYNGVTQTVVYYNVTGSANAKILNNVVSIYYNSNTGKWVVTTLVDCVFNNTSYSANDIIAEWGYSSYHDGHIKYSSNSENGGILVYNGIWDTNGKDGWNVMLSINNMSYSILNAINNRYTKPSTGIPKTDLSSDVQTSLGKADSALQSIPAEYITETKLNAKGYASQSDLDTTNTNISANTNAIENIETSLETLSNSLSSSLTTLQTAIANKFIIRRWA